VGSPDGRASFVSGVWRHYELCIEILMQLDHQHPEKQFAAAAFLLNDKSRARLLLELLNEAQADQHDGAIAELLNKERELRVYLTTLGRYELDVSLHKKGSTELAEVNKQIAQLTSQHQEVQAQLRQRMPARPSLDRFTPNNLDQVQNELRGSDTLLLDFDLGDERSYLWAVTANSFHSYELPSRKIIEEAASELYKFGSARQEQNGDNVAVPLPDVARSDKLFDEKAAVLSDMLIGPITQELGNRHLLIVAEGALQSIPFEALPFPGRPETRLINTNEISRTPSISTLVAIRAENKRVAKPDKIAAVIADPVFSKSDDRVQNAGVSGAIASAASGQNSSGSTAQDTASLRDKVPARLPYAAEEADAISAAAPRGTTMVAKGFDATYETAMSSSVGQYQIVHFATHGFLDSEHPELSGIVLSMVDRNGVEKNGLMPLHDIYNMNLSAELTVLSACQTALGKDVRGEGLVGLTHSFISAGSKSVVASLWKVDDRATAALMGEFYKALLQDGMTTGAALRAAKLKLMQDKRWSAPYYWAGFVLQGEYTNHIAVNRNSSFGPGVLLLSVVLISSGVMFVQRRRRRSVPARRA
jgi:CHAT domain-containing protein